MGSNALLVHSATHKATIIVSGLGESPGGLHNMFEWVETTYIHTYIHIYIHTCTYIHTYIHTCTYMYVAFAGS